MSDHWMADVFRVAVYVAYALLVGQAAAVLWFYYLARRSLLKAGFPRPKGLLPLHVMFISISYIGIATITFISSVQHVGEGLTWSIVPTLVFLLVGDYALWVLMRFEYQRRVREVRPVMSYHLPGEIHVVDESLPFQRLTPHTPQHRSKKP